jgi:hypothetical protein
LNHTPLSFAAVSPDFLAELVLHSRELIGARHQLLEQAHDAGRLRAPSATLGNAAGRIGIGISACLRRQRSVAPITS